MNQAGLWGSEFFRCYKHSPKKVRRVNVSQMDQHYITVISTKNPTLKELKISC